MLCGVYSNPLSRFRYLEVCRKIVVDDLTVVKSGLVTFFPPEYSIYDRMITFYHNCVTDRIKEIASTELEKNEIAQLLGWIKDYGFVASFVLALFLC